MPLAAVKAILLQLVCVAWPTVSAQSLPCEMNTQQYCGMRCQNFTSAISPTACSAKALRVQCVDQFDRVVVGSNASVFGSEDIWINCSNSTTPFELRPPVVQPTNCDSSSWMAAVVDPTYTNRKNLSNETYFLWNVADGVLSAKMVHKGNAGYLSFGFRNMTDTLYGGMMGGKVIMGLNDPVAGPSVNEYHIDYQNLGFRWWNTPLSPPAVQKASLQVSDCFISMTFQTSSIFGQAIDFTQDGNNYFMWALTHLDYPTTQYGGYAGKHTDPTGRQSRRMFRGRFILNLFANASSSRPTSEASSILPRFAVFIVTLSAFVSETSFN